MVRDDTNMCILFLYFCDNPSPNGYRLIMASNRDEFYFRPTAHAKFWEENPSIIAGRSIYSSYLQSMYGIINSVLKSHYFRFTVFTPVNFITIIPDRLPENS